MATTSRTGSWLLRRPPDDAESLLFCFPYAGVGASSYRTWPQEIAGAAVCALQPPGRENRLREKAHPTHAAFAEDLVAFLADLVDRPYAFAGHCGAIPFALETIHLLHDRGLPLPAKLVASSWGAPHKGLYGPLNFVDIDRHDLVAEVERMFGSMGVSMPKELAHIAAGVLRDDLRVQRPYRYDAARRVPVPVTVVSWTRDDVVPPEQVDNGWEEVADVRHVTLDGEHLAFLQCPPGLRALLEAELAPSRV